MKHRIYPFGVALLLVIVDFAHYYKFMDWLFIFDWLGEIIFLTLPLITGIVIGFSSATFSAKAKMLFALLICTILLRVVYMTVNFEEVLTDSFDVGQRLLFIVFFTLILIPVLKFVPMVLGTVFASWVRSKFVTEKNEI